MMGQLVQTFHHWCSLSFLHGHRFNRWLTFSSRSLVAAAFVVAAAGVAAATAAAAAAVGPVSCMDYCMDLYALLVVVDE